MSWTICSERAATMWPQRRLHLIFIASAVAVMTAVSINAAEVSAGSGILAVRNGSGPAAGPVSPATPQQTFRDCPDVCPEMVVVPAGTFMMGTSPHRREKLTQELGAFFTNEGPVRAITIEKPFAVGIYEVSWAEWGECVDAGSCDGAAPDATGGDNGWGKGNRPVVEVSWHHALSYIRWLSEKTGHQYRLLTEAEWEYAASAHSDANFSWGNEVGEAKANCNGCGSKWDNLKTAPVGSFEPNAFGLYDMQGNVREWVKDCWAENYDHLPLNGAAYTQPNCTLRVVRGGAWNLPPIYLRLEARDCYHPDDQLNTVGFRVARTIAPD
jgi:formylglycine-generating enzyme required for sulfatase activity